MSSDLFFALNVMWKGMLGIFIVIGVIMSFVYLLNLIPSNDNK